MSVAHINPIRRSYEAVPCRQHLCVRLKLIFGHSHERRCYSQDCSIADKKMTSRVARKVSIASHSKVSDCLLNQTTSKANALVFLRHVIQMLLTNALFIKSFFKGNVCGAVRDSSVRGPGTKLPTRAVFFGGRSLEKFIAAAAWSCPQFHPHGFFTAFALQ